jgi:hypothetical protein
LKRYILRQEANFFCSLCCINNIFIDGACFKPWWQWEGAGAGWDKQKGIPFDNSRMMDELLQFHIITPNQKGKAIVQ